MSTDNLDKKTEELIGAVKALVLAVKGFVIVREDTVQSAAANMGADKTPAKEDKPKAKKSTKKADKELKDKVMESAKVVMESCGRDELAKLLSQFGVNKIGDLTPGQNVYPDFLNRAAELIKATAGIVEEETKAEEQTEEKVEEVDPLDDSPKLTMEDVKTSCKKVLEHEKLGRNFLLGILSEFKVEKLGELKAAQYGDVVAMAEKELVKTNGDAA